MGRCAKIRCEAPAEVAVQPRYASRELLVLDPPSDRLRGTLDLCAEHMVRMVPPPGWRVRDARSRASGAA